MKLHPYAIVLMLAFCVLGALEVVITLFYPADIPTFLPYELIALFVLIVVGYLSNRKWGEYRPKSIQPSRSAVAAVRTGIAMLVIGFGWMIPAIIFPPLASLSTVVFLMFGVAIVGAMLIAAAHILSISIPIYSLIAYSFSKKHRQDEEL